MTLTLYRSCNNAAVLQVLGLFPRLSKPRPSNKMSRHPATQILPKRCTVRRPNASWTRKRSSSTSKKAFPDRLRTTGKTSIAQESPDTSTASTLGTNGTSTTRRTTSTFCSRYCDYWSTLTMLSSTDNPPPKVVQGYKVWFAYRVVHPGQTSLT